MTNGILKAIVGGYTLSWHGVHGLHHWGRVLENGARLAELTGADPRVGECFALFHDCRRRNEGRDPQHGQRGSEFAAKLHEEGALGLTADQFAQLQYACEHHTEGLVEADVTIQTCWDADRLDLGRVCITPDPRCLCTSVAKDPVTIAWAEIRSREDRRPPIVDEWFAWLA
jgi:uncharacterized protein